MKPVNIGIVSIYFSRGGGYIALQIKEAFQKANHKVSILARMSETDGERRLSFTDEFFHNDLYLYPTYTICNKDFEGWLTRNKIEKVVFVEEHFTRNLIEVCNKLQIESYNYVVWENINPGDFDYYKKFTKLICPVKCTYDLLKKSGLTNMVYVPWGIDLRKFPYQPPVKKDKTQFLFLDGWGGSHNRKNEDAVIRAFSKIITRDNSTLRIHTQRKNRDEKGQRYLRTSGQLNHQQLLELYRKSDIVLNPSKWEGNCLGDYQASACGRPVITVDAPPMNEHVENCVNGMACEIERFKEYPGIYIKGAIIDLDDFARIMLENSELDYELFYNSCITSRRVAEERFDWDKNGVKLVDVVVETL